MEILKKIAGILVIIGGLNWGLVGIDEGWNVVELITFGLGWLESTVYILVGLSALLLIFGKGVSKSSEEKISEPASEPEMPQNDMAM